jgi:hypothetical protein
MVTDSVCIAGNKVPNEMTPESTHDELPPQIWGAWPSIDESQALDIPDVPSEIDWVSPNYVSACYASLIALNSLCGILLCKDSRI